MMRAQGGPDDEPVFGFIAADDVAQRGDVGVRDRHGPPCARTDGTGQEIRTSLAARACCCRSVS